MKSFNQTPDRRFWVAYDYFKATQDARALRRERIYAVLRRLAGRVKTALANAGAQPVKPSNAGRL